MTDAYLLPIKTAAALFPLLALALFLPTAVALYRRHGVMSRGGPCRCTGSCTTR
ncbi:hypothetical protein SAZ11_33490 [Streptomyces sp. FXJ1.4098]|nr:hypothetical protein [Streptomyces sp. FXJ1.4098]